jgi:hypothetical protein
VFRRLRERFLEWYYGPWEAPASDDSDLIFLGHHNPHWTARIAQALVNLWLRQWPWIIGTVIAIIALVIAALAFLQQQEPSIEMRVDHQTKILSLSNSSMVPVTVRAWAVEFGINLILDAQQHALINKDDPIKSFSTHGAIIPASTIGPLATLTRDLTQFPQLKFDEWTGQEPDWTVYCIAFEEKSWLGKTTVDTLLTPKLKFSASPFGPLPRNSAMGGGYPKTLLALEKQMKTDCLTILEKSR